MSKRKRVAVLQQDERSPIQVYMEKHKLSQEAFADRIGVSQGLVWQWLNGKTKITAERARDIEEITKGELTLVALRPDLFAPARAA